jgi:hypothetical protein
MEKREDGITYPINWHPPGKLTSTPPMMIVSIAYAACAKRKGIVLNGVGHPTNGALRTAVG